MRTALQRSNVKIPALVTGPESIFELVLDVEQPNANRTCEKRDRQLHKQEWTQADQPDHCSGENCDCEVRYHRAQPEVPTAAHQSDWQSVLQDEQIHRTDAKHYDRIPIQPIQEPTPSG